MARGRRGGLRILNRIRKLFARGIVAVLLGIIVGYAVGRSLASDAERGRNLTMKAYIADFESHRAELVDNAMPMVAALVVGTLMVVVALAGYEVLALGVDKLLSLLDRQRAP